jgi:hypothetical protein
MWFLFSCSLGFADCGFVGSVDEQQCRQVVLTASASLTPMVCIGPGAIRVQSLFYEGK